MTPPLSPKCWGAERPCLNVPNTELLKADVRDELGKLERLRRDFTELESLLAKPPEDVPFYDRAAVGYYLHSFYNGCENIFRSIARFFENDLSPKGWRADLLKRMRLYGLRLPPRRD